MISGSLTDMSLSEKRCQITQHIHTIAVTASEFTILIYFKSAVSATNYMMNRLQSPQELKQSIFDEKPLLKRAFSKENHLEATSFLREYAYNHIIWSNDQLNLSFFDPQNLNRLNVAQIKFLMDCKEIGVLCSGASLFLAKLFCLFGYKSGTFNYGLHFTDESYSPTHTTTLVEIPTPAGSSLLIQDATFNFTYFNNENNEFDFIEIVKHLKAANGSSIEIAKGRPRKIPIAHRRGTDSQQFIKYYKDTNVFISPLKQEKSRLTNTEIIWAFGDLDYHSSFLKRRLSQIQSALNKATGYPKESCSPIQLMLFPLNLHFVDGLFSINIMEALSAFFDSVDQHNIFC
jgi:hypothetical protein